MVVAEVARAKKECYNIKAQYPSASRGVGSHLKAL